MAKFNIIHTRSYIDVYFNPSRNSYTIKNYKTHKEVEIPYWKFESCLNAEEAYRLALDENREEVFYA